MVRGLRALVFVALTLAGLAAGCSKRIPLHGGPARFPSGVHVRLESAYVAGNRVYIHARLLNGSEGPIYINPDGIALRLPDGRQVRRSALAGTPGPEQPSTRQRTFLGLRRGFSRDVVVELEAARDLGDVTHATLVLGGISFGTNPTAFVVGELPLSAAQAAPSVPHLLTPAPQAR